MIKQVRKPFPRLFDEILEAVHSETAYREVKM